VWQALKTYDPSRNASVRTHVFNSIASTIGGEVRSRKKAKIRERRLVAFSLDEPIKYQGYDTPMEQHERHGRQAPDEAMLDNEFSTLFNLHAKRKVKPHWLIVKWLRVFGHTQHEIATVFGARRQAVQNIERRIDAALKKERQREKRGLRQETH